MIIHDVQQGSAEWRALRAQNRCASDAPVVMGASSKTRRNDYIRMKATGTEKEVSDYIQKYVFDPGHKYEAEARVLIERDIRDDLFPVTGTDGKGNLASFDGLTFNRRTGFEHKTWSAELAEMIAAGELTPEYYWQLEHQFLVNEDLEEIWFVASHGKPDKFCFLRYVPVPGRREQLIEGWKVADADIANYKPEAPVEVIEANPAPSLPAIIYKLNGLALTSNLDDYRRGAEVLLDLAKKPLETDQDFADRDLLCKAFDTAEKRIDLLLEQVMGEIQDVDKFRRGLLEIKEKFASARIAGTNAIKKEKDSRKLKIQQDAVARINAHIAKVNEELGRVKLPNYVNSVAEAMKNKRTIATLQDAADTSVANSIVDINQMANQIKVNLETYDTVAKDHEFLFSDLQSIITKTPADFILTVNARIDEFKRREEEEARRKAERQEEEARKAEQTQQEQASLLDQPTTQEAEVAVANASMKSLDEEFLVTPATALKESRPSDDHIIAALALYYRVHESKVIEWLLDMDLNSASERMARNI